MNKQIEALKIFSMLLCLNLAGCNSYFDSKCVNGKYYEKWCEKCQFKRNKSVECLDEQTD